MQIAAFFFPCNTVYLSVHVPSKHPLVCISGVLLDEKSKKNVFNGTAGCVILQAFS